MKKEYPSKKSTSSQKNIFISVIIIGLVFIALPLSYFAANSKLGTQTNNNSHADTSQQGINTPYCKEKGCYWIIGNVTPFSGNSKTTNWNIKVIIDGTQQNHEGNVVCSVFDGKGLFSQIIGNKNFTSLPFVWNIQFHVTDAKNANGMYAKCKAVVNADNSHGFSWNSSFISFIQ